MNLSKIDNFSSKNFGECWDSNPGQLLTIVLCHSPFTEIFFCDQFRTCLLKKTLTKKVVIILKSSQIFNKAIIVRVKRKMMEQSKAVFSRG